MIVKATFKGSFRRDTYFVQGYEYSLEFLCPGPELQIRAIATQGQELQRPYRYTKLSDFLADWDVLA